MVFSDSIWNDFPDTGRLTGAYIVFYQVVPIDNLRHITGPVDKFSSES